MALKATKTLLKWVYFTFISDNINDFTYLNNILVLKTRVLKVVNRVQNHKMHLSKSEFVECLKCFFVFFYQFAPEAVLTRTILLCRRSESVLTRIPIFACSGGWLVNTPLLAWHKSGRRVYTHLLLRVNSTTAKWFRTIGTANNEWVHSLCWYLPNPFIEHLFFWRSSHGFVNTDLYPLYRGLLIYMYVRDTVFSPLRWSTCRPLLRACQRSNFAKERRP